VFSNLAVDRHTIHRIYNENMCMPMIVYNSKCGWRSCGCFWRDCVCRRAVVVPPPALRAPLAAHSLHRLYDSLPPLARPQRRKHLCSILNHQFYFALLIYLPVSFNSRLPRLLILRSCWSFRPPAFHSACDSFGPESCIPTKPPPQG
jgi:hypothetical protein